jgi:hypothetical protein
MGREEAIRCTVGSMTPGRMYVSSDFFIPVDRLTLVVPALPVLNLKHAYLQEDQYLEHNIRIYERKKGCLLQVIV